MIRFPCGLLTVLLIPVPGLCQANADKLDAPPAVDIAKARLDIADAFAGEFTKAKTPAAKKALSGKLLGIANEPKESIAGRWVLYGQARDLAAAAGEVALAFQAVEEWMKAFRGNRKDIFIETADKFAKTIPTAAARTLLDLVQKEADEAAEADDYEYALKLYAIGGRFAPNAKDASMARRFESAPRRLKEQAKAFEQAKGNDEHMGRFLCFQKGNWAKGLPLLAQGKEETWTAIAKRDLENPADSKDRCELGNGWYDLAEPIKAEQRVPLLRRAYHWYRIGFGGLSGVAKVKAEARMQSIAEEIDRDDAKSGLFTLLEGHWAIRYTSDHSWEYDITPSGNVVVSKSRDRDGIKSRVYRRESAILMVWDDGKVVERAQFQGGNVIFERFWDREYPRKTHAVGTGLWQGPSPK